MRFSLVGDFRAAIGLGMRPGMGLAMGMRMRRGMGLAIGMRMGLAIGMGMRPGMGLAMKLHRLSYCKMIATPVLSGGKFSVLSLLN